MSMNVGSIDRLLRAILGLVLMAAPFVLASPLWTSPTLKWGAVAVGAVLLATSVLRFCPLYRLIGVNTCRN